MSAIEKAAAMLREEAEILKACHTLDGDWRGDPAEADYHEMIAVADAAIAERDELLEALQWYEAKAVQMGRAAIDQDSKLLLELMKEIAVEYGSRARAAIAKATGEQP